MSHGNGAGMRVSGCAYAAETLEEALLLSDLVTGVTHNHPEGMLGARAVTATTFLARQGKSKEEIRRYIVENFYPLDFTIGEIQNDYWKGRGLGTCGNSIPQALQAFFESTDFESAIRLAVGLGGDTDTLGAMVELRQVPTTAFRMRRRRRSKPISRKICARQLPVLNRAFLFECVAG